MSRLQHVSMLSCIAELDENSAKKLQEDASPITGIVRGLMCSSLSSVSPLQRNSAEEVHKDLEPVPACGQAESGSDEGLFKNAFKIKNTPESTLKPRPKTRRLLGMASRRISSPEPDSPSADKENSNIAYSPCGSSPQKQYIQQMIGSKRIRQPLEDCDPNSQDSGYEACYPEKNEKPRESFQFAEPLAVAPRRTSIESRSPMESPVRSSPQRARFVRPSLFRSLSSGYESMDDGFNDLIDIEPLDDTTQLPNGISTLLNGNIVSSESNDSENAAAPDSTIFDTVVDSNDSSTPESYRSNCSGRNFRRSFSLQNERQQKQESRKNVSLSKVRSRLFRSPNASSSTGNLTFEEHSPLASTISNIRRRRIDSTGGSDVSTTAGRSSSSSSSAFDSSTFSIKTFKRPDPPHDESPKLIKRLRMSSNFLDAIKDGTDQLSPKVLPLQRSLSETGTSATESESHALIKSAVHRSTTDNDLTGDFSKPCILPLAAGHHQDLKSISADTLASLIRGELQDRIGSFKIVDCRYPYEFDAGHIEGALNLYNKDLIERILLDPLSNKPEIQPDSNKRNILVFHCEFSWERGPNLSRFLRKLDRQRNKEHYPALHYPEVYLLHGGYEEFYREQIGLCSPQGYRPMRHPDHEADLRQFRSKSKSWQGEKSRSSSYTTRTNLKRLGF